MFYHFLAPEGGHPTREDNSTEKNTRMQVPFFLATPLNLINKSNEVLFQKVQQRYTRLINTICLRSFIIDQSRNTLQLKKYCAELTLLLSQSLPFLQLQVCDLKTLKD